ncbi:uncharacterized protein [Coffea arabica]|uniref:Uncharacterized protein n=1 Tax=Coffea arabica TaxID=13443 RepID=A0A6P6T0K6_COFAR|nr:uncharacterized protein LOC113696657 [Coffea arabica]
MEESDNSEEELPVDGKVGFLVVRKVLAARAIEEDDMQRQVKVPFHIGKYEDEVVKQMVMEDATHQFEDSYLIDTKELKLDREVLKSWNCECFGYIGRSVQHTERELFRVQKIYDRSGREEERVRLGKARTEHTHLLAIEQDFWLQKAVVKWMKEGDANTSYFHAMIRQCRNQNFKARIKNEDGKWLQTNQEIKLSAVEFFSALFRFEAGVARLNDIPFFLHSISLQQRSRLELMPTEEEVSWVVFDMDKDNAVGSDGFLALFYQTCWQLIKKDLMAAV